MDNISRWFRNIPPARASRWLLVLSLSGLACALVSALVLAQTGLTPAALLAGPPAANSAWVPEQPAMDAFIPERLTAFSGNGFDLRPELMALLDDFSQGLERKTTPPTTLDDLARQLSLRTDPQFVTFTQYTIQRGDNFWKLAKDLGFTIDTIVGCNPQMEKIICYVGQKILLPSRGGCLHQVRPGEDLAAIAFDYRADPAAIAQANRLNQEWGMEPGTWLFIPGAKPLYLTQGMYQQYAKRALFRSPLTGRYTSFVGLRIHPVLGFSKYHNGVDISCKDRSWVGAAAPGTVVAAGWGGAIGKYIKIDHHNGYETVYGHLSVIYVRSGQSVKGGQLIARSGSTGRSTGPHLHFTIWDHGVVRNPMDYLW
jgi:hypothetical protein